MDDLRRLRESGGPKIVQGHGAVQPPSGAKGRVRQKLAAQIPLPTKTPSYRGASMAAAGVVALTVLPLVMWRPKTAPVSPAVPVLIGEPATLPAVEPTPKASAPKPRKAAKASKETSLLAEAKRLAEVRRYLDAGEPSHALSALRAIALEFGASPLVAERDVLVLEARVKSQTAGGCADARLFVSEHPDSPYLRQVERLVTLCTPDVP
jgi:hypothetical protein